MGMMIKMRIITLTVQTDKAERTDKYISVNIPELTRSRVQKLISENHVTVNGKPCSKKLSVNKGDEITVEIPEPEILKAVPQDIPLDIVYEDDELLVVNKPRGMVVHPAAGNPDGTLVNALMFHCGERLSSINGVVRPGIVHRIDKDTSGLLMVAKTDFSHLSLSEQIKEHSFKRQYIALVDGKLKEDSGTINKPIGRSEKDRKKMTVTYTNSREAVTDYEVLKRYSKNTLIRCTLHTGRTHQIRVHMLSVGHPITGDKVYGPEKQPLFSEGQLLHACLLGFIHPKTNEYMEFYAPVPQEFRAVIDKLERKEIQT